MNHSLLKHIRYFFSLYGVGIGTTLIVLNQLIWVSDGLTRWRGGGLGMYSDFHPNSRQITIITPDCQVEDLKEGKVFNKWKPLLLHYPNDDNCKKFSQEFLKETGANKVYVQIWQPSFNPNTLVYSRSLLKQYYHG